MLRGRELPSGVGPAMGRLIFANFPPLSLFQVQIFGGMYSFKSVTFGLGFMHYEFV